MGWDEEGGVVGVRKGKGGLVGYAKMVGCREMRRGYRDESGGVRV